MRLESLLNIHGHIEWNQQDPKLIPGQLVTDSRQVQAGDIFVAIRGHSHDGHDHIVGAVKLGASAVVVEDKSKVPKSFKGAVVEVLDTRLSLQVLAQRYFAHPGDQMLALAITGTNGKTSTAYIVEHLLNKQNKNCGVIGTIDHHLTDKTWPNPLTTPDPVTLQKRLRDFIDHGAMAFVIEASSHALHQNRIRQGFDVTVFTNLSRDHLDYHKTMDDYFNSKAQLFGSAYLKELGENIAVINGDDPYGEKLVEMTQGRRVYSFGQSSHNHFQFHIDRADLSGCQVTLDGPKGVVSQFHSPLIGDHNVYNVVGVLVSLYALGLDLKQACKDIESFAGIPGRMQHLVSTDDVHVFVDYAHTPEALQQSIQSLKKYQPSRGRLITVFGCGGDRDRGKRPLMAKVAQQGSDQIVVTSDNPRSENPKAIVEDILTGVAPSTDDVVLVEVDRHQAIATAIAQAQSHDIVLIAGKGHEDYQVLADKTIHFSDFAEAEKALKQRSQP